MRVALDAAPLKLSSGGLARYTAELASALASEFPGDDFRLVSGQERFWWLWGVRRSMDRLRTDVFHGTNFEVPYLPQRPSVLSLHDLSPWMDRSWHHGAGRVRQRTPALIGLGIATMILTDSEAVRRQAIAHFRIHPDRIVAVPLAAAAKFRPVAGRPAPRPYFLYVGTLEPRKNLPLLVEAWRPVRDRYGIDQVLAGRRREDFPQLPDEPGLRVPGEVPDEDLPAPYYAGAGLRLSISVRRIRTAGARSHAVRRRRDHLDGPGNRRSDRRRRSPARSSVSALVE